MPTYTLFFIYGKGPHVMVRENAFQAKVIRELRSVFPGCIILINDPNYIQGFPDITILYKTKWAVLECKKSLYEPYRPNQEYYLELCDDMSFGSMICPENMKGVLDELQQTLAPRRAARVSKRV